MHDAIRHMEEAMREMEERLRIPNDGAHEKDPVFEEMQNKMRALVEKINLLAGRMNIR